MNKKYALLLLALVVVIWGANWTVTKLVVQSIPPLWSTALRCLIAALALLPLQLLTKQFIWPRRRDVPAIMVVSFFHMSIFASLMAIGLQYTSVGRSAILGYTTPLWVTPAAIFFLKEPINKVRLGGVLLGIIGVCILFSPVILDFNFTQDLLGSALLLLASFSWAIAIVGIKVVTWHASAFQLVLWQTLVAMVITAIVAFFFEGIPSIVWTPQLLWQMAYTSLLGTAFGFWAMTVINRHLSAIVTSLGLLATPVFGMIFSQFMLDEHPDTQLILASIFILVGIGLGCMQTTKQ